jgi:hypothetical protein
MNTTAMCSLALHRERVTPVTNGIERSLSPSLLDNVPTYLIKNRWNQLMQQKAQTQKTAGLGADDDLTDYETPYDDSFID